MFNELYTDAYERLKNEIRSIAGRILLEGTEKHNAYYSGQWHAMNEVIEIMNKIDEKLYTSLSREAEKEAAYYESELSVDESRSKQL